MKLFCNTILTLLILLASTSANAQSLNVEKEIGQIRKEYQRTNKAKLTATTIHYINEKCQPYAEGSVTHYYENGKLVKIYSKGGEDHGEWKEEYYFKDGKLFFIYQNNAWGGAEKPTYYKLQRRIYIKNDNALKTLETSSVKDLTKANAEEIIQFIKTANALKTAATKEQVVEVLFCREETDN